MHVETSDNWNALYNWQKWEKEITFEFSITPSIQSKYDRSLTGSLGLSSIPLTVWNNERYSDYWQSLKYWAEKNTDYHNYPVVYQYNLTTLSPASKQDYILTENSHTDERATH